MEIRQTSINYCISIDIMKKYEGSTLINHDWQQIAIAFWNRYPNKYSKHVLSEDILDRRIDSHGQLITKRLFVKTNSCPRWIERLMQTKNVHIIEESVFDPLRRTLTTITRNLGATNLLTIEEVCVYKPHKSEENTTVLERTAVFDSKLSGFKKLAVLRLSFERYKHNIKRTDLGFRQVIQGLFRKQDI